MIRTDPFVTIVSGLPRSGTSLMMRMIDAGGMPVMADGIRTADDDNPRGYYEFEAVKRTKDDPAWLRDAPGKAVKMVYRLLYDLPTHIACRVIFMRREMSEILASQKIMLQRKGSDADAVGDDQMAAFFQSELAAFQQWRERRQGMALLEVNYNRLLREPQIHVNEINRFLGGGLDASAMQQVIEPALYRNRAVTA